MRQRIAAIALQKKQEKGKPERKGKRRSRAPGFDSPSPLQAGDRPPQLSLKGQPQSGFRGQGGLKDVYCSRREQRDGGKRDERLHHHQYLRPVR